MWKIPMVTCCVLDLSLRIEAVGKRSSRHYWSNIDAPRPRFCAHEFTFVSCVGRHRNSTFCTASLRSLAFGNLTG